MKNSLFLPSRTSYNFPPPSGCNFQYREGSLWCRPEVYGPYPYTLSTLSTFFHLPLSTPYPVSSCPSPSRNNVYVGIDEVILSMFEITKCINFKLIIVKKLSDLSQLHMEDVPISMSRWVKGFYLNLAISTVK